MNDKSWKRNKKLRNQDCKMPFTSRTNLICITWSFNLGLFKATCIGFKIFRVDILLEALAVINVFIFLYFKVARVAYIKLGFTGKLFYNLIILIKQCKIQWLNLDKALLFPRNQAICMKNWKLWRAPTTIEFNIFG